MRAWQGQDHAGEPIPKIHYGLFGWPSRSYWLIPAPLPQFLADEEDMDRRLDYRRPDHSCRTAPGGSPAEPRRRPMTVRCKFTCQQIEHGHVDPYSDEVNVAVTLTAAYAFEKDKDGNQILENRDVFGKWTPSGDIKMWLRNPRAAAQFEKGKSYYVTFDQAD